jgi:ADP-ribose pyrophosphatase YjhB (NUDIX family)
LNSSFSIGQRYRVFLNEKSILISEDINTADYQVTDSIVKYQGKTEMLLEYERFKANDVSGQLVFVAKNNFQKACFSFRSMFREIKAAGGVVMDNEKNMLCIFRLGVWDLPKGKLKKNEMPAMGACREVTEETGLSQLKIIKPLPSTFHIYDDRKGREVLKETYWFEMQYKGNETPVPQAEEDITSVRWFRPNELDVVLEKTYASLKVLIAGYL